VYRLDPFVELGTQEIQARLGHASITTTLAAHVV
jgi:hypothetical protein